MRKKFAVFLSKFLVNAEPILYCAQNVCTDRAILSLRRGTNLLSFIHRTVDEESGSGPSTHWEIIRRKSK